MLSLAEYDKIAIKLIFSWCKNGGNIKYSSELHGRVVRFLCMADWKYDPKKSKRTQEEYRRMWGIYAIREYLKPSKHEFFPLNDNMYYKNVSDNDKISRKINFLINNSGLTSREFSLIDKILSCGDISISCESLGITYDQGRKLYKSALYKMKRVSDVE